MHRFFGEIFKENEIILSQEDSKHLAKVLRLKKGDEIEIIDGKGSLFTCSISEITNKQATVTVLSSKQGNKSEQEVWLAVAPPKNLNRWEWFLEKAVEIGINRISPIITQNSERKVLKRERQLKILKSALKQSKGLYLPQLDDLISLKDFTKKDLSEQNFVAHCYDVEEDKNHLKNHLDKNLSALVLIGPEGDFAKSEVQMLLDKHFKAISLGKNRLRTETAALVACHTLNLQYE